MKTELFDVSKRKFCSFGALALAFSGFINPAIAKAAANGDSPKSGEGSKSLEEKFEALQRKLNRLEDIQEIARLQARYEAVHCSDESLAWSLFANRPDTSQEITAAKVIGFENIKKHYVDDLSTPDCAHGICFDKATFEAVPDELKPYYNVGAQGNKFTVHPIATPCIVVAGDGKTAEATFTSLGFEGKNWCYGKYANSYIKTDGKWYIWHMKWLRCFKTPYSVSWGDQPVDGIYEFTKGQKDEHGNPKLNPEVNYNYLLAPNRELKTITEPTPYETWTKDDEDGNWWKRKTIEP